MMTISTGLMWFQPQAAASRRRGPMAALIAPLILASTVLAAPGAAWAAVVVTDAPDFEVAIDAGESVVVSCNVSQVRVEVVGASTTDYLTTCGAVTSLTVTASLAFDNSIDLSAVAAASFPALTSVLLAGGPGADTLTGSALDDAFTWTSGGGNDTILGGSGYDTLSFNGSGADENVSLVADGSGFDVQRDIAGHPRCRRGRKRHCSAR
jgi:Ca2+-binding RTX toxin-like protein